MTNNAPAILPLEDFSLFFIHLCTKNHHENFKALKILSQKGTSRNKLELLVEGVVDSLSHNLLRGLLPVSTNNATFPASGSIPFEFAHSLLWAVE